MSVRLRDFINSSPHVAMYVVRGEDKSFDQMYRGLWKV
jgi:hypothetical protein